MFTEKDFEYMRLAALMAEESVANGGGPFGAVIVRDGEIVERGKHEELLKLNGLYKRLNDMQSL